MKPCNNCVVHPKRRGSGQRFCSEECKLEARARWKRPDKAAVRDRATKRRRAAGATIRPATWDSEGNRYCPGGGHYVDPQSFRHGYCDACRPVVARRRKLWGSYRLTQEDYDRLLEEQSGLCAICLETGPLQVDHDHSCCPGEKSCGDCVRGLLCRRCNYTILGAAKDNAELLQRAADYVKRDA